MDALKKAEHAKRQAAQGEAGAAPDPSPAPQAQPGDTLPELPRELSVLDDQFAPAQGGMSASARSAPNSEMPASDVQRDREAAHNLFTAKRSPSRAPFWIGLTTSTLAAVVAIGYWFWWQLQPPPGALKVGPALAQLLPTAPPALAQPAPATQAMPAQTPAPAVAAPQAAAASVVPPKETLRSMTNRPEDQARASQPAPSASARATDPTRAGSFAAEPRPSDADAPGEPRLRRVAVPREHINPAVARGYDAYVAGDMASAKRHYEDALRGDPHALDALNGMAAIALRAGRRDLAETYLMRALEADPRDGYALSALAALKGQNDPQAAESRLKGLISAAPDSPAAHFGLGNLYARDGRWAEAQQAYFRAFSSEPDNPDFQFNLAVSLDHLRQSRLALQYYQSALAATRPGAFDREQAAARVRDLQQYLQH